MMNARSNLPYSEQFRIVAKDWVEKDAAARLLEETKTAVLSRMISQQGDMPHAHAERAVKASEEWLDFIEKMVAARTAANLAKVKKEFVDMQYWEDQRHDANRRAEMRM